MLCYRNYQNNIGQTAENLARKQGHIEIADYLVEVVRRKASAKAKRERQAREEEERRLRDAELEKEMKRAGLI